MQCYNTSKWKAEVYHEKVFPQTILQRWPDGRSSFCMGIFNYFRLLSGKPFMLLRFLAASARFRQIAVADKCAGAGAAAVFACFILFYPWNGIFLQAGFKPLQMAFLGDHCVAGRIVLCMYWFQWTTGGISLRSNRCGWLKCVMYQKK